ncbi:hypothetical protein GH714_040178 [Hevea brasiliensis]|uniref:Leucine-rich repeat-containing N-terminal plant-type domain-containing protein n=1 Tax=Hevea brasiliensis TaxID=3981 RepID=A0A6A6MTM3_HEVBR|nr:hypothetical protein GH714_040178 [Hevea brasiliensis]
MGSATATVVEILAILILLQSVLFCCNTANVNGSCIRLKEKLLSRSRQAMASTVHTVAFMGRDNCCRWEGVACDNITGHVVELSFYWDDLQGKVSLHLGNLSNLQDLYLNQDQIVGRIMVPECHSHAAHEWSWDTSEYWACGEDNQARCCGLHGGIEGGHHIDIGYVHGQKLQPCSVGTQGEECPANVELSGGAQPLAIPNSQGMVHSRLRAARWRHQLHPHVHHHTLPPNKLIMSVILNP